MIDPVLPLTLCVEGPAISQDSAAATFDFDAAAMMADGKVVLPGSQIKGLLREVFESAIEAKAPGLDPCWLTKWFGKASSSLEDTTEGSYEPRTGRLFFADLTAKPAHEDAAITRVAVDHERGSVREGMLQVVQAPWGYGDIARFKGEVRVLGTADPAMLGALKSSLDWAFKLIPAVGAFKTAGFGRLLDAKTGEWAPLSHARSPTDDAQTAVNAILEAGGADFVLRPGEPFIVWPLSFGGNFFAGDAAIPGQVLKAVAARWLSGRGLLDGNEDALAGLVFRHAWPVSEDTPAAPRPARIPLSVYLAIDEKGDIAAKGDALAMENENDFDDYSALSTIAFQPDWKYVPSCLAAAYGHGEQPARATRTRTAIGEGGIAEDERLFTHAAVDPRGFIWRTQVLIPRDSNDALAGQMAELLAALNGTSLGLGKTKAPLEWKSNPLKKTPTATARGEVWHVVLQTPACLHGPAATRSKLPGPVAALREDYEAYWRSTLGKGTCLVDFMARQRLAGGYLARRYPAAPDVGFEPYLLTEPGSIFVLKGDGLENKLDEIAVAGLPLSGCWPTEQRDWKTHPFLREAGWGEVRISGECPLAPELSQ